MRAKRVKVGSTENAKLNRELRSRGDFFPGDVVLTIEVLPIGKSAWEESKYPVDAAFKKGNIYLKPRYEIDQVRPLIAPSRSVPCHAVLSPVFLAQHISHICRARLESIPSQRAPAICQQKDMAVVVVAWRGVEWWHGVAFELSVLSDDSSKV